MTNIEKLKNLLDDTLDKCISQGIDTNRLAQALLDTIWEARCALIKAAQPKEKQDKFYHP